AQEGQKVSSGDVVADVETDKATMELPVYDDGTLSKIVIPEGQAVPVGTVIAVLAEKGEAAGSGGAGSAKASGAQRTMAQKVEAIATPVKSGGAEARVVAESRPHAAGTSTADISSHDDEEHSEEGGARMRISPVARQLAEEHGIDVKRIQGSGPNGRVIKRDVLAVIGTTKETGAAIPPAAKSGAIEKAEPREAVSAPKAMAKAKPGVDGMRAPMVSGHMLAMSNMRQVIAKRLVESKQTIPHYQVTMTFSMDPLLAFRKELNEQLAEHGVKLSVNDFLVRACALAMHEHELFNASWAGDSIEVHSDVNIGVAIALPAERGGGLVVATIRNADQKSLRVISYETKMLSEKARTRGLSIEEMADSTFTISNLGMFGVEHFTAIINPPNSAILAVGAAIEKPVVRDHQLAVGHEMNATLSCDHRVIDGATAAQYMQTLKQMIEQPGMLVV
ncbi:MAG TPA: dihydrolipoamide acetyltransferase family protein, partial [Phycisphaerales bacterium]|nr:dihydrolipoamide acetyltransferase family protein [Phycisphaerales bacterium]